MGTRTESDGLGVIEVPGSAYWGALTQRSLVHFRLGFELVPMDLIRALGILKKSVALVNHDLGRLPVRKAHLIVQAADDVIAGRLNDHFPLPVWLNGSASHANMNVNEVIANRAIELAGGVLGSNDPIHPHDHVNLSHSADDALPTAMHMAAAEKLRNDLIPAVQRTQEAVDAKAKELAELVKADCTHHPDDAPPTMVQQVAGWSSLLARNIGRLRLVLDGLFDLAIGGTAVGSGINAHPAFAPRAAKTIAAITGMPFRSHPNRFAALCSHDELVFAHGAVATLAGSLMRIGTDIRWLAATRRGNAGELGTPDTEPGSSAAPGTDRSSQCDTLTMVAVQVHGNHAAIASAVSQGRSAPNAFRPVIIHHFLQSATLVREACRDLVDRLVSRVALRPSRIAWDVTKSLLLTTALTPQIGYDQAAQITQLAISENIGLRDACVKLEFLSGEEFDRLVRLESPTHP